MGRAAWNKLDDDEFTPAKCDVISLTVRQWSVGHSPGGGAENAGVENAGVITYGKPKFEKRLTVFTASNLKSLKYIIISYIECSTASYHNLWNFGTPTIMGLSPVGYVGEAR